MAMDYWAALGLEAPADPAAEAATGAKDPETAEPGAGEKAPEIAEPAAEQDNPAGNQEPPEPDAEETEPEEEPAADKDTQSKEERAKNAAQRREAEQQQAINKAVVQAIDAEYAALGLANPYTNQPVKSKVDYDAYIKAKQAEEQKKADDQVNAQLKRSGLGRETLDAVVAQHPLVQQAAQLIQQTESERAQQKQQKTRADIDRQVAEITALDPSIKTLEDINGKPYLDQMTKLVKRGYTLVDAFKVCTEEDRNKAAYERGRQTALNSANNKAHLQPPKSGGGSTDDVTVPEAVAKSYRAMMPGVTDAEIKAHYAKDHKKFGG